MRLRRSAAALLVTGLLSGIPVCSQAQGAKPSPYMDPSLSPEQRAKDLVSRMTLEEKVSQTINTADAIPRLDVPAYDWWNEGLHGVARSGYATMFPQAIGMAATWDAPLLGRIADVISTEARAKNNEALRHDIHSIYYGLTIWSPNINIFRDPRWGRGQETYGEDPFLTSRLGVSFVKGLQGDNATYFKTIATPKHYAVHSGPESTRHSANVDPTPHDLWDTYLPAFRATITEGKADSIMCAYNAIDGAPACASKMLLQNILRGDWHFKGFVTSDCGAIDDFYSPEGHHFSPNAEAASAAGIRAGTDTNCGSTYKKALVDAVKQGVIQESEIDTSIERLFEARIRLGLFDPAARVPYSSIPFTEVNSAAHQALALEAAEKAMVLLKNSGNTLPLQASRFKSVAVIGPSAADLSTIEGNYNAIPHDPVLPLDALIKSFPSAKVTYAQGAPFAENAPLVIPRTQFRTAPGSTTEGLKAEYFANDNLSGPPALTRTDKQIDFDWNGASPLSTAIAPGSFSVRWTGTMQVPAPGDYKIDGIVEHCYPCKDSEHYTLKLDGKELTPAGDTVDKSQHGATTGAVTFHFADTEPHAVEFTYAHTTKISGAGFALRWTPPVEPLRAQAMEVVKQADLVLAFIGLNPNLEGEEMPIHIPGFSGGDRTDIELPAAQRELLEAAKAAGKPLVVVMLNGSALAVNWAGEHADAILEAWYPGQAGAQAITETLTGKNNPGGRLPVTFYTSLNELPPFDNYAMGNRTYRYFKGKTLFGFGYGLSYTTFSYSGLKLSTTSLKAGDNLTVEADIRNTGKLAGDEVAELYLTPPQTAVSPVLALAGFHRVHLAPGQSTHVSFTLDPRTLSQVDDGGVRSVTPGSYTLHVGGSQPTPQTPSATFTITGTQQLPH